MLTIVYCTTTQDNIPTKEEVTTPGDDVSAAQLSLKCNNTLSR